MNRRHRRDETLTDFARRVIYLAPNRALVSEKAREWKQRLGRIGITFAELTSDQNYRGDVWGEIENVDVILATPEKFDRVTRLDANRGGMSFFSDVAAVLIDEVHLIGDERGGCLEAIVSRLKLLSKSAALLQSHLRNVRFGAVSATIPNIENLAQWLDAGPEGTFVFGEEFRPVKLQTFVRSFRDATNDFLFSKFLKQHVYGVIQEFYRGKQTIVFLGSRDNALQTAKELVVASRNNGNVYVNPSCAHLLQEAARRAKNKGLGECIAAGVAFHHAGLEREDRELAEQLFRDRLIIVLCSTSTLAMGVNLPAYLAVVAGTQVYDGGGTYKELSMDNLLQMIGRAGRPQYDTEGVAVVMTKNSMRGRYEGLVHGRFPLESSLGASLPEYLNAEISCRTINSIDDAFDWVKSTFYYIRTSHAPQKYGVQRDAEDAVKRSIESTIHELVSTGMCEMVGNSLQPLRAGDIMSLRYLRFNTMKNIMKNVASPTYANFLKMLCESEELCNVKLRRDERKLLKELNQEQRIVRFPVQEASPKGKKLSIAKVIRTGGEKLYLVAQYALTDIIEPTISLLPSMRMEGEKIFHLGTRIMRAASEYYQSVQSFSAAVNAFALAKGIDVQKWPDSNMHVSQLKHARIKNMVKKLALAKITTFQDVEAADPRRIEMKVEKQFPFGNTLQGDVKDFPSELKIKMSHHVVSKESYNIDVTISFKDTSSSKLCTNHLPKKYQGTIFVGSEHDDRLLYIQRIPIREFNVDSTQEASSVVLHGRFNCSNVPGDNVPLCLKAHIVFEGCVGRDIEEYYTVARDGNRSPCTPNKSSSTPIYSSSPARLKQTTIVMDKQTKRYRLAGLDNAVRKIVDFEDFEMPNEGSSPNSRSRKKSLHKDDICNRCGQQGHWASQCTLPDTRSEDERPGPKPGDRCRKCGELGHYARTCPMVLATETALRGTDSDSQDDESWDFIFSS